MATFSISQEIHLSAFLPDSKMDAVIVIRSNNRMTLESDCMDYAFSPRDADILSKMFKKASKIARHTNFPEYETIEV